MKNHVELKDSSVEISKDSFIIKSRNISITVSYLESAGFVIESFKNTAGEREVDYVSSPMPFMPFKADGTEAQSIKSAENELVNAMSSTTAEDKRSLGCGKWRLVSASAKLQRYGGAMVPTLCATVEDGELKLTLNAVSFPSSSVIRYWFDIENLTEERRPLELSPFSLSFEMDRSYDIYRVTWFTGGRATHDYGKRNEQAFGMRVPKITVSSRMTAQYVPLFVCYREGTPHDGVMVEMDYIANWHMSFERRGYAIATDFGIDEDEPFALLPHEEISSPTITLAAYARDLDELMVTLYDWQYAYMWDYTLDDYFGKCRDMARNYPWVYCSRNLHEQFSYRLVCMDMLGAQALASAGIDMSWDDAGWSSFPGWPDDEYMSVFKNTYEGPDHRLSTRYFDKLGMKRLIWFAGKPSLGLLGTKEGAWGEFEWRTDEVYNKNLREEAAFKKRVRSYLDGGLRRSFHTCSGGATYCNTFDIQRYANYNYASDNGMGPHSIYNFTYFDLPDRWGDSLPAFGGEFYASDLSHSFGIKSDKDKWYNPDIARGNLIMTGRIAPAGGENEPLIREDENIYTYLKREGVAGKWSYMFHPGVYGDREIYYMQRTSHDRLRAAIIIRRRPEGRVIVYPKGLIPNESYTVSFELSDESYTVTGERLMEEGIVLRSVQPRELIYLNLTSSPRRAKGTPAPQIRRVLCRRETNVGTTGIGIYWSADSEYVRYYEIMRNGEQIAVSTKPRYYFDIDAPLDGSAEYSVRAVGYGDSLSAPHAAEYLSLGSLVYSTFGSHGENMERRGWFAELSCDLKSFTPMKWTPPAKNPGADFGGTPNQVGGIEGYFEGASSAKLGRGWQQADPDEYCIRAFRAPYSGKIRLTGRAVKEWYHSEYGSDIEAFVLLNERTLVAPYTLRRSDLAGLSYDLTLDINEGDVLRFVLGRADGEHNAAVHYEKDANIIGWNTMIEYLSGSDADEPFSLRINCGGEASLDGDGAFCADSYFKGGRAITSSGKGIFGSCRTADEGDSICYEIPVPDGLYALRLSFLEDKYDSVNERYMKLDACGSVLDGELDLIHDARGSHVPYSKTYRYLVPDADGYLRIRLSSERGGVTLSALELFSENENVYHINCGGEAFVDWAGFGWIGDSYYEGGSAVFGEVPELRQASPTLYDKALYYTGREGKDFSYSIPVKGGLYSVQLKFAELSDIEPGSRPMDIYINSRLVKEGYDARSAAGEWPMTADLRFPDIASLDGVITVRIVSRGKLPAILRAIEID